MKTFVITGLLMVVFISCKKESTITQPLVETIPPTVMVTVKDSGNFMNGPYGSVSGLAKIYKNGAKYQLALENFRSDNGPDLKVYLSKEIQPVNFVNLGSLKSTNGNQLYDIPAGAVLSDYKYALVHCQQYNHLFGYAALKT